MKRQAQKVLKTRT